MSIDKWDAPFLILNARAVIYSIKIHCVSCIHFSNNI